MKNYILPYSIHSPKAYAAIEELRGILAMAIAIATAMAPVAATAYAKTNSVGSIASMNVAVNATNAAVIESPLKKPVSAPNEVVALSNAFQPAPSSTGEAQGEHDVGNVGKEDDKMPIAAVSEAKCPGLCGIIAVVAVVAIIGLIVAIWRKNDNPGNLIRCAELLALFAILGLILCGTYNLLDKLVGNLNDFNARFAFQENVDNADAVQKAYAQLSSELQRWLTLLGVFGAFFGLVVPVGGYLLQIKAVDRNKEEVDKRFRESEVAAERKIAEAVRSIDVAKEKVGKVEKKTTVAGEKIAAAEKRMDSVERKMVEVERKMATAKDDVDSVAEKVVAAEKDIGSVKYTIASTEKTMQREMSGIWQQQIGVCKWLAMQHFNVVHNRLRKGWRRNYAIEALGLFTWVSIIITCAFVCSNEDEISDAVEFVCKLYDDLKMNVPDNVWNRFVKDLKEANTRLQIRIDPEKLDKDSREELEAFADEVGMRIVLLQQGEAK